MPVSYRVYTIEKNGKMCFGQIKRCGTRLQSAYRYLFDGICETGTRGYSSGKQKEWPGQKGRECLRKELFPAWMYIMAGW